LYSTDKEELDGDPKNQKSITDDAPTVGLIRKPL
jgi:hypothetical protein